MAHEKHGAIYRIVETFLKGNLSMLGIILTLFLGASALFLTPREEDPQIVVPLVDLMVSVPGASAREVERQVTTRLEKILYQIDGVEYVYSTSQPNRAVVTARFFVGENREDSLVKIQTKLAMNTDRIPPQVAGWVIKPVEIDDVPIVNIAIHSKTQSDYQLRRIAEELESKLQSVKNTGPTYIVGGRPRAMRIEFDPERLAGRGLGVTDIERAIRGADVLLPAGSFQQHDREIVVDAGVTIQNKKDLENLVIGVNNDRPVYLRDVATILDAPAEVTSYTQFGFGPASEKSSTPEYGTVNNNDNKLQSCVTVAVAKRKGSNAVWVSRAVQQKTAQLAETLFPAGVEYDITRDYGQTADDKVNDLVENLFIAIIIIVALLAYVMGWRESLIVATAVPLTFSLTLFVNLIAGYTINRVTLFALILALGLVVDDPIVDVENIYRHFQMRKEKPFQAILTAVNEVRPPIILATLAVIVSFIPMFFITGMMGPYMRPMALNVPLAMTMSIVVAFTVTPWMSYYILRGKYDEPQDEPYDLHKSLLYKTYARIVAPILDRKFLQWGMVSIMTILFIASCLLAVFRFVPLKMLPYDNKNEFLIVVDMPEGTTLERTATATRDLAQYLMTVPEVTNVSTYAGIASPMDFNGMVRHYYLRQGANVAEIHVNLIDKVNRQQQSHEIGLRIRNKLTAIGDQYNANIKLVETPPGPPVISTLTVEVYGQPYFSYAQLQEAARKVQARFKKETGVVDIDSTIEAEQERFVFHTDKEKAALAGLSTQSIAHVLQTALGGETVAVAHDPDEANPLLITLRLPRAQRSDIHRLENLLIAGPTGNMVPLREIGHFTQTTVDQSIYHKNLLPVVYVFAEMAGKTPEEAVLDMSGELKPGSSTSPIPAGYRLEWAGEGEWKITVDVFRDLGIAFGFALLGIYGLLVQQTKSYFMPIILMISIPLTIIGIMPGFWFLNILWNHPIGGYGNPVFFTATAMIGMIALAGIAVRNAILLIDFIHAALEEESNLHQAILDAGAVRFRPIFLTAGAAILAAIPITFDPIFSGLAWALIFGLFVSTAFTLVVVPVVYWMFYQHHTYHPTLEE